MRPFVFFLLAQLTATASLAVDSRNLVISVEVPRGSYVTNLSIDKMANAAGAVARRKDADQDTACDLRVVRSGDVVQHQTLPKEITTRKQLDAIAALPVDVFVVDQLSVCGIYENEPAVAGCERAGPLLVEVGGPDYLTLIHEMGHKIGLHHTTTTDLCEKNPTLSGVPDLQKNNILFCRRHLDRTWLTASDCSKFIATSQFPDDQADLDGMPGVDLGNVSDELPAIGPVAALLAGLFEEGIDFDRIFSLTDDQLASIRSAFQGDDVAVWEQAAYVLGIRGDARDLESLIALAHRAANIPTPEGYRARSAAPEAIGLYLAYHKQAQGVNWAKAFLLSNVSTAGARTLGNEDEIGLISNRYAQAAALTGDLALAQSALDILSAQGSDLEIQQSIAARALASENALPQAVIQGDVPSAPNSIDLLRERAGGLQLQDDSYLVDVLRRYDIGLDSVIVKRFKDLQFGAAPIDVQILDQRVQELMLNAQ